MSAIAELKAVASLDNKQFQTAAKQTTASARKMQQELGTIGTAGRAVTSSLASIASAVGVAFSVSAVVGFGKALATEAAQLKRTSDALGVSVGMMDALGDAAEATGASSEGFQRVISKLSDSQEEAVKGNKDAIDSFARLGVSVQELTTLAPDQLLARIASGAQKDATAISDLNNVMGKGAAQDYMAVLQKIGTEGLPGVDKSVEESIKKFAQLESQYQRIKDKLGEFFMGAVVGTVKAFGGFKQGPSDDRAEIDALNRRFVRERGLQEQLAAKKKEDADKVAQKEAENAKRLQEQISKLRLRSDEQRAELLARQEEQLQAIRVSPAQARNTLEAIGGSLSSSIMSGAAKQIEERQLKQQEIIAETNKKVEKNTAEMWRAIRDLSKE